MSDSHRASLSKHLVNRETQTVTSPFFQQELFNMKKDQLKLKQEESLYKFQYSLQNVEHLVSAINGNDETIRNKGKVIRSSHRFQSLIQSLKDQIETNSQYAKTRREQKFIVEQFMRSLAYAIDPASRYGRNIKGSKEPLYSHQKYEHSIKHGSAIFVHPVQVNLSNSEVSEEDEQQEFELIYTYDNILYLMNDTNILKISGFKPDQLFNGNQIQIFNRKNSIGHITIQESPHLNEEEDDDNQAMPPHFHIIEPITETNRMSFLIHVLNGSTANDRMNLKLLVNPYDFSFIDVMLSIPQLPFEEIRDLVIFMYKENYLSAYINSKLCQFLYYSRGHFNNGDQSRQIESAREENGKTHIRVNVKTNAASKQQRAREWPDLLGRLITLLDHQWFIDMAHQIENLDLPFVIKNIVQSEASPSKKSKTQITYMNPLAQYVMGIILDEYECQQRGDTTEFLWEFLCKSVFANLYMRKYDSDQKMRHKLEALYLGTKDKPQTSKTRSNTRKVVNQLIDLSNNQSIAQVLEELNSNTKSKTTFLKKFNSQDFLMKVITAHQNDILHILRNIPYTTEEASPLFFPIILEVRDALYALEQGKEIIVTSPTIESPIVSDVLIEEEEEKIVVKKKKVTRKQPKRATSCKTEIKEKTVTKTQKRIIEPAIPQYHQLQQSSDDLEYSLSGSSGKLSKPRSSSVNNNPKKKAKSKKPVKMQPNKVRKLQLDSEDEN